MTIVDLRGREHEPAVVSLLAASQIHRALEDASRRAPSIAEEYARSDALRLWGYQHQGDMLGVVGVELIDAESAVIRDLAVAPEQRRTGVGRALIDYLQSAHGFVGLEGATLAAAAPFYERCGFQVSAGGRMPDGATRYRFIWRRHPAPQ